MAEEQVCEHCHVHQAEVVMRGPGGETMYLCTAPECMMAAGMCPSCNVQLARKELETGEVVLECSACGYRKVLVPYGQWDPDQGTDQGTGR